MKNLKLFGLVLSGFLILSPLNVEASNPNKEDILNKEISEYDEKEEVYVGRTIIEADPNYERTINSYEIKEVINLIPRDIVLVNGRGKSQCSGGIDTIEFQDTLMVVVGVKRNQEYTYALAPLNSDLSIGDVVGWFKIDNLKKATIEVKKLLHDNVVKDIIYATQIGMDYIAEEDRFVPEMALPYDYEWLGDFNGIRTFYEHQPIEEEYLYGFRNYEFDSEGVDAIIYTTEDEEKFTYYHDYINGLMYRYYSQDQVTTSKEDLSKRYNIKNVYHK